MQNYHSLPKKDITLIVADFDDTIFARKEQLEDDENLRKFRGRAGIEYIVNVLGIGNYVKKYYTGKTFPKSIVSELEKNENLILTAGVPELQKTKLKALSLDKFDYLVVYDGEAKPNALLEYIEKNLGYIPNKIVVYEDRPNHFIERKKELEKTLGTTLEIMFVEMNGNDEEPKITKVEDLDFNDEDFWDKEYWIKLLKNEKDLDFTKDNWIEKYREIFDKIKKGKALDLGCGIGQDTIFLLNEGYDVISADISLEALNKLKTKVAKAKTIKLDMNKPLEFKDKEFELVLANLSTHYFNWNDTFKLYDEIKRILKNGGYFIGRVNSTETVDDNVKNSTIIEENFYFNKKYMRFFNKEQFDKLFENCDIIILNEITTKRLGREKNIWEFIVKNR